MTIRPVENPDTGHWDILEWKSNGQTFPLPGGMKFQVSSANGADRTAKQRANDTTMQVAGQLWALGITVHMELLEE